MHTLHYCLLTYNFCVEYVSPPYQSTQTIHKLDDAVAS